jgi:predicted transcriptional regulator
VFVRGKKPGKDIIELARESNVPVLSTAMTMFQAAGVLYGALSGR